MWNRIPTEELIGELHRLADELGVTPRRRDMDSRGEFDSSTYGTRFGSWSAAVREAGLKPRSSGYPEIPKEALISELHRLRDELGEVPRSADMGERGDFSPDTYNRRFGSWNSALKSAGFSTNHRHSITDRELLDEVQRLADELDKPPSSPDMRVRGKFSVGSYVEHFGSWGNALSEVGYEPFDSIRGEYGPSYGCTGEEHPLYGLTGEDHPKYNGGFKRYGSGWTETKKEAVRERDSRTCQNPGCGRTEAEHLEEFGQKHSVHHIMKARWFDDDEERNAMDNLITLCQTKECHAKWEAMSPLRPIVGD